MLHSRNERIEEAVKESLVALFSLEMQDPDLPDSITITKVEVARDLRNATVYFSQEPDDKESVRRTMSLIERSKGYIKFYVANDVNMRQTPDFHFRYDPSAKKIQRIEELLQDLKSKGELKNDPPAE